MYQLNPECDIDAFFASLGAQTLGLPDRAVEGLAEAEAWAESHGLRPHCERKTVSLAFHWRGLSETEASSIRERVQQRFKDADREYGLVLHDFDGGLELRVKGIDKGRAVRQVLSELTGNAAIAYLGDDRTDEDAFAALAGRGLRDIGHTGPTCLKSQKDIYSLETVTTCNLQLVFQA
jgi:trehalose 6-phosphate phosphatase